MRVRGYYFEGKGELAQVITKQIEPSPSQSDFKTFRPSRAELDGKIQKKLFQQVCINRGIARYACFFCESRKRDGRMDGRTEKRLKNVTDGRTDSQKKG